MKSTHIETVAIHGSMRAQKAENSPIVPGIELSTIYEHAKDGHREGDLKYMFGFKVGELTVFFKKN